MGSIKRKADGLYEVYRPIRSGIGYKIQTISFNDGLTDADLLFIVLDRLSIEKNAAAIYYLQKALDAMK